MDKSQSTAGEGRRTGLRHPVELEPGVAGAGVFRGRPPDRAGLAVRFRKPPETGESR